jgi:hypothetical protein
VGAKHTSHFLHRCDVRDHSKNPRDQVHFGWINYLLLISKSARENRMNQNSQEPIVLQAVCNSNSARCLLPAF